MPVYRSMVFYAMFCCTPTMRVCVDVHVQRTETRHIHLYNHRVQRGLAAAEERLGSLLGPPTGGAAAAVT